NEENELVDFVNNVIFNWGINSVYGGELGRYNVVNNYYKPGPATSKSRKFRIVNPSVPYGKFYVDGNYMDGSNVISANNWNGGVQAENPLQAKADKAFETGMSKTTSAEIAYQQVIHFAGASKVRDGYDELIVQQVMTGIATDGKNK